VERLPWNDSEVPVAHEEEEEKPKAAEDDAMAGTCVERWVSIHVQRRGEISSGRKITSLI